MTQEQIIKREKQCEKKGRHKFRYKGPGVEVCSHCKTRRVDTVVRVIIRRHEV